MILDFFIKEIGMLRPSYLDLMNSVNESAEELGEPPVESRYSIIMAASKRARQIVDGAEVLVDEPSVKPLSTAIDEIYQKKVTILGSEEE